VGAAGSGPSLTICAVPRHQDERPDERGVASSERLDPVEAWTRALGAWAIPEEILAAAPESPWQVPPEWFARRADLQIERREGRSIARAEEAIGAGGSVLDVGAGAGAASLPLHGLTELTAVDTQPKMLEELVVRARRRGLRTTTVLGRWPDVAARTAPADVVVCHHVLYNVPDFVPFVHELDSHARRRVVIEITAAHPISWLNPLWRHFHQLQRPERPTWQDAAAVLKAIGLDPTVERARRTAPQPSVESFEALVRMTRIRLCLDTSREDEVAVELRRLGVLPEEPRSWMLGSPEIVTLWWDRSLGPAPS
jgi:2-polyprenyl-3-methyl-5-hydroxy-6-metoxy-1,4-benzoquinol methylase